MVHGITFYSCGHERCRCPCQASHGELELKLPQACPECGGPADKVKDYAAIHAAREAAEQALKGLRGG